MSLDHIGELPEVRRYTELHECDTYYDAEAELRLADAALAAADRECGKRDLALKMAVSQMYGSHGVGDPGVLCFACQSRYESLLKEATDLRPRAEEGAK